MKRRETRSLVVVTGAFAAILMALIAAGVATGSPRLEQVVATDLARHVSDAQFVEYVEYRARMEISSNCQ